MVVERLSYDAFGKRRHSNGADDPAGAITSQTTRSYTGHETHSDVGLVNMNARLYDPTIGRVTSADSVIPDAANGQAWNRYSYVINNPLKYTDPTGNQYSGCNSPGCEHAIDLDPISVSRRSPYLGFYPSSPGGGGPGGGGGSGLPGAASSVYFSSNSIAGMATLTAVLSPQNNARSAPGMKSGAPLKIVITRPNPEAAPGNAEAAATSEAYQEASGSEAIALDTIEVSVKRTANQHSNYQGGTATEPGLGEPWFSPIDLISGSFFGKLAVAGVAISTRVVQRGASVLGHYPGYVTLAENVGARYFSVPKHVWDKMTPAEQWAANSRFLDRLVARGDTVMLSTAASEARAGSWFARELGYLSERGYTLSVDGMRMIPPR